MEGAFSKNSTEETKRMIQFNRERVPERTVFAKGAGAFGYFQPYHSMEPYTKADFLQSAERMTKVFVRFSLFSGSQGCADTVRDLHGFAVRFYTREGNYDLECASLPVFFIRDKGKFMDLVHAVRPSADTNVRDRHRFWEFVSRAPETTHMLTWLYTDKGTVADYSQMDGWGSNTYIWVNAEGERCYVRYALRAMDRGIPLDQYEAQRMAGIDPDIASRRLYQAVTEGHFPRYELRVQMICQRDFGSLDFDPLDATKIWPERLFAPRRVGVLTLKEKPESFFEQVEQSAFSPGNLVPGIEASADPMLEDRAFCCLDAQRYRIGEHFMRLPVNQAITSYRARPARTEPYGRLEGTPAYRPDHYTQAGEHYRSMPSCEQAYLHESIAQELCGCRGETIRRVLGHLSAADGRMADGVAAAMRQTAENIPCHSDRADV